MRKVIHIASALMAAVLAFISCERADGNRPDVQEGGRPIQFTVESEWPEITKAVITDVEGMKAEGFRVWSDWHQDPADEYYYQGSTPVYGDTGTKVNASEDGTWLSEDEGDWYKGYYTFAAAYPASIDGTHSSTFTKRTSATYSNSLSLDLTNFHLGSSQTDLMYAFANVDNSAENASVVSLNFSHMFSLLTIRISATSTQNLPRVKKISIYGIHSTLKGSLTLTHTTTSDSEHTLESNMDDVLAAAELSSEDVPYWSQEYDESDFNYGYVDKIVLVENLLVYPETLSETCPLVIKVECEDGTEMKSMVTSGSWSPGSTNAYTLMVG